MHKKDFYRYVFSQFKQYKIKVIDCKDTYGDNDLEDYFVISKDNYFTVYKFSFNNKSNLIEVLIKDELVNTKYIDVKRCVDFAEPIINEFNTNMISIKVATNNESINIFVDYIRNQIDNRVKMNSKRK